MSSSPHHPQPNKNLDRFTPAHQIIACVHIFRCVFLHKRKNPANFRNGYTTKTSQKCWCHTELLLTEVTRCSQFLRITNTGWRNFEFAIFHILFFAAVSLSAECLVGCRFHCLCHTVCPPSVYYRRCFVRKTGINKWKWLFGKTKLRKFRRNVTRQWLVDYGNRLHFPSVISLFLSLSTHSPTVASPYAPIVCLCTVLLLLHKIN